MKSPQQQLRTLEKEYCRNVYKIAAAARIKYVIPYCDRRNFHFIAGMGGWHFTDTQGRLYGFNDGWQNSIPSALAKVLEAETLGHNDLGSLIDDYKPKGFKRIDTR